MQINIPPAPHTLLAVTLCVLLVLFMPGQAWAAADTDFVSKLVTEFYKKTPVTIQPCSVASVITQNYSISLSIIIQRCLTPWGIMQVFSGYASGYGHYFNLNEREDTP